MKAIVCTQLGGPETLALQEITLAPPGPNEVRIRIASAGINFPDILQIAGKYQFKATPPFTPGAEVAGTVTAIGAKVGNVAVGDRVAAIVPIGGYAEEVNANADSLLKLPADFDLSIADGKLKPYISKAYPLADAAEAMRDMQARKVTGKIVLVP